jgi:hypothetical protein
MLVLLNVYMTTGSWLCSEARTINTDGPWAKKMAISLGLINEVLECDRDDRELRDLAAMLQ